MKYFILIFLLHLTFSVIAPNNNSNKNDKRKLGLLDWFNDSDEEQHETEGSSESMTKIMELIKMADEFKSDPHFKVSLNINYKNLGSKQINDLQKSSNEHDRILSEEQFKI